MVGDFGSFTLALGSPVEYALHYGGAVSNAVGASLAGVPRVYALTGDGGFSHGLYGLVEASRKGSNINCIVIDNGGISSREDLNLDLEKLARGNGAEYVRVIDNEHLGIEHIEDMERVKRPSVLIVKYKKSI